MLGDGPAAAHDPLLGQRDEHRLAGPAGEHGGLRLTASSSVGPSVIRPSSAAFILKPTGGKSWRPWRLSARTIRLGFRLAAWTASLTRMVTTPVSGSST